MVWYTPCTVRNQCILVVERISVLYVASRYIDANNTYRNNRGECTISDSDRLMDNSTIARMACPVRRIFDKARWSGRCIEASCDTGDLANNHPIRSTRSNFVDKADILLASRCGCEFLAVKQCGGPCTNAVTKCGNANRGMCIQLER